MSEVMDRIRQAAAKAAAGPLADARERPQFERVAAQSPFPPEAGREEYVERFRAELEALTAKVYGPFDADDAIEQVTRLILQAVGRGGGETETEADAETRGRGDGPHPQPLPHKERGDTQHSEPRTQNSELSSGLRTQHSGLSTQHPALTPVLSWAENEIECPGLADKLRQAGISLVSGRVPNDENHQNVLEKLATMEVGLTGAVAGLADTGSIIVASGAGRSRIASLLPPVHIALLPVERIYPTMQDWLVGGGADLVAQSANVVVITGSSRTSDIELQLTLGMHGPKELHVVLLR
ncbi:MAG: LutC/YkgG family protein [Chloroflexota bacterium]|jgi:L-lactate utilization protein LutC